MVALLSKPRLIQIEETKLIKLLNEFVDFRRFKFESLIQILPESFPLSWCFQFEQDVGPWIFTRLN